MPDTAPVFFCSALLCLTGVVPNSGIPDSEVIVHLTSNISKENGFRYKAIGRPLAKLQLTKKFFILSCTGKMQ